MAILPMAAMGDHIMFWHSALSALNISAVLQNGILKQRRGPMASSLLTETRWVSRKPSKNSHLYKLWEKIC